MNRGRPSPSLPVAVDRAYELWLWLDGPVVDLPAVVRQSTGRHLGEAVVPTAHFGGQS